MRKIEKTIIIFMIIIGVLILGRTTVKAASLPTSGNKVSGSDLKGGVTYPISMVGYDKYNNLHCAEPGDHMSHWSTRNYKLIAHVHIKGEEAYLCNLSTKSKKPGSKIEGDSNLKMATGIATLSDKNQGYFLWGYLKPWISKVNEKNDQYGVIDGFAKKDISDKKNPEYDNIMETVEKRMEQYKTPETKKFKVEKDTENFNYADIDNYKRLGPYTMTGIPSVGLKSFEIMDQNGTYITESVLFITYTADKQRKEVAFDEIKEGQKFYLCIPKNKGIEFITAEVTTKKIKEKVPECDIYFLSCSDKSWQNLVVTEGGVKDNPDGDNLDFTFDEYMPGELTIIKQDADNRSVKLPGAKFVIFRYVKDDNGSWYKKGDGYTQNRSEADDKDTTYIREYLCKKNSKSYTYVKIGYDSIKNDSSYIFTTNAGGKINLTNLKPATYFAREVEAPEGYNITNSIVKLGKVVQNQKQNATVLNTPGDPPPPPGGDPEKGSLRIVKQDADTAERLAGVRFRVVGSNYVQYVTTNAYGEAYVYDLEPGDYLIEELNNPIYGYTVMVNELVTIEEEEVEEGEEPKQPEMVTVIMKNQKQTGNLRIRKVDADSNRAMSRVSFKIRLPNGKYVAALTEDGDFLVKAIGRILLGGIEEVDSEDAATEFITDDDGLVEIYNILIGDYQVIETSLGNHDAYELDDNYIFWSSNRGSGTGRVSSVSVNRQPSYNTRNSNNGNADQVTVGNRRKYIDLSGYVWQDIEPTAKDAEGGNGLYKDNNNDNRDRLLKDIKVQLKDKNGVAQLKDKEGNTYSAEALTDSNGHYEFKRLEIDKLPEYYIEFTYNGMSYQSVKPTLDMKIENGSRAIEGENRTKFNSRYETITYGRSNAHNLQYDTADNESKLVYGNKSNYNYGYDGNIGAPVSGVDEQYIITADTYQAYQDYIGGSRGIMTPEEARRNEVEEIKNINLGIEAREQIDLSLVKDLNTVTVGINHATHVYQYGDRYKPGLWKEDPYNMSPRVKFEQEYGTMSYTRALYASDVFAGSNITDDTLRVKVTYKIGIKNASINLVTTVNEIEDYYDSKYLDGLDNVKVGTLVDEKGDIVPGTELQKEFVNSGSNDYYKMKIKGSVEVKDQKESFVYVQLEVKPENIIDILGTQKKLFNIAEISSYSTKKGNDIYASIDKDSQPGNLKIDDKTTYEDDTDRAPGLQLVLQEQRKLDGKVFIDTTTGELQTAQVRQGDGEYKEGEPGVQGVDVKLLNLNKNRRCSRYIQ